MLSSYCIRAFQILDAENLKGEAKLINWFHKSHNPKNK